MVLSCLLFAMLLEEMSSPKIQFLLYRVSELYSAFNPAILKIIGDFLTVVTDRVHCQKFAEIKEIHVVAIESQPFRTQLIRNFVLFERIIK